MLAAVLSNCLHLLIQICLLLGLVFLSGYSIHRSWLWLPYVWTMEIIFVCGLSLATSALNVYVRDMRYLVESATTVLFWLVGIFYSPPSASLPWLYTKIDNHNPLSALILSMRLILRDGRAPEWRHARRQVGGVFCIIYVCLRLDPVPEAEAPVLRSSVSHEYRRVP